MITDQLYDTLQESSSGLAAIVKSAISTPGSYIEKHIELQIAGQSWMNGDVLLDVSHGEMVSLAHGDVLLAGLGLGGDVLLLKDNPIINSIHVVESSQDVIDLVWQLVAGNNPKLSIYTNTIEHFLQTTNLSFDLIWLDTFIEDGWMIPDTIYALLQLAQPKLKQGGLALAWRDPQNNTQGEI